MKYRIENLSSFTVVGTKERVSLSNNAIPRLWGEANENGLMKKLINILMANELKQPTGILGVCANGDHGNNDEFDYYFAAASDHEPPAGMERLLFSAFKWAVFDVSSLDDMVNVWKRVYTEWFPTSAS